MPQRGLQRLVQRVESRAKHVYVQDPNYVSFEVMKIKHVPLMFYATLVAERATKGFQREIRPL